MYASKHIAQLVTLPALRRYTGLSFWDTLLFDGRAAQLARSPHLQQLVHLGLRETCLHDEDLVPILRSHAYPRLQSLDISNRREGQDYTFEGFRVITEAEFAPSLERLAMNRRYFDEDIVSVFAQLPQLHALSVEGSSLGSGAIDLAALDRRWTELDISWSGIRSDSAEAIARSDSMCELTSLHIGNNPLSDEGVRTLVTSPKLGRLKTLEMGGSSPEEGRVSAVLGDAMRRAPMADTLETLLLSLASLGPRGATWLAEAPLGRLRRLNLHNNGVGDEGAIALSSSKHLHAMRHLDISGPGITDAGAYALVESECFENLDWLELGGAELSGNAKSALKKTLR